MRIQKFDDREAWLEARLGKVTGTRLKDLINKRATKPKKGFYEIIAERVAIPTGDESMMDRGIRLEDVAIELFTEKTGKKINNDLVLWERDDNSYIAISPDGTVIDEAAAVEVKCLNSASHIEAFLTKEIPSEFEYQILQYFCVNDALQTLYFIFYDPRTPIEIFWIPVERKDKEADIAFCLQAQIEALILIKDYENKLTF